MTQHKGGCACGKVRVTASGLPDRVGICHCIDCRKHHGALFYAAAIFSAKAVEVSGETKSYQGRHFCPDCGGSVFAITDDEIELYLGALDTPSQFVPDYETWVERREDWLPEFPNTVCFRRDRE